MQRLLQLRFTETQSLTQKRGEEERRGGGETEKERAEVKRQKEERNLHVLHNMQI